MFKLQMPLCYPPEVGAGSGGTSENSGETSTGGVTSGTASEAMIAAFEASSASGDATDPDPTETIPTGEVGDTAVTGVKVDPATSGAKGPQVPTGSRGEAPPSRIEAAVKNARAEATAEVEKRYEWAKDLDPASVNIAFQLAGRILQDQKGFTEKLALEQGFKLVPITEAGKPAPIATGEPLTFPKGGLKSEDGIEAYSTDQVREIVTNALTSLRTEFQGMLKPHGDALASAQDAERKAAIQSEAKASVDTFMGDARKMRHFQVTDKTGNKIDHPDILKNLMEIPEQARARMGFQAAVYQAYNKYLQERVFPFIGQTAQADVRKENAKKAASSFGVMRPGSSGSTGADVKLKDGDVSGLANHLRQMAETSGVA